MVWFLRDIKTELYKLQVNDNIYFSIKKAALIAHGGKYLPLVTEHKRLSLSPVTASQLSKQQEGLQGKHSSDLCLWLLLLNVQF